MRPDLKKKTIDGKIKRSRNENNCKREQIVESAAKDHENVIRCCDCHAFPIVARGQGSSLDKGCRISNKKNKF